VRPLKNAQFCRRSRKTKNLTTGIHLVFRGLNFEYDAEIGQKGVFFKGLLWDRPLIDHLKEVAWAFFLVLLFLVCLWVVFGSQIGFKNAFLVCLGFAVIVAVLFLMILLTELMWFGIIKLFRRFLFKE
jgi:hypothetical protein